MRQLENEGTIYTAYCVPSHKMYVGQTVNFERRRLNHEKAEGDGLFACAMRKHGRRAFRWRIIKADIWTRSELNFWEKTYIYLLNTYGGTGYNMTKGGEGTATLNPEIAKKVSKAVREYRRRNPDKHPMLNPQSRAKVSAGLSKYYRNNPDLNPMKNPPRGPESTNISL